MYGFSLIEVLISMALLAVVLLGLDAMALATLRDSRETYLFSVAANQLQVMEERLSLLQSPQAIRRQIAIWDHENKAVLPNGRGEFDGSVLTIYWGDQRQRDCRQTQEGVSGCLSKEIAVLG